MMRTVAVVAFASLAAALTPTRLQVEHQNAPIDIDEEKPRFSWALVPDWDTSPRGLAQEAYQVVVQTNPCGSPPEQVWDSGKVASNSTALVEYDGKALQPNTRYTWTVKSWMSDGSVTGTAQSSFATALLNDGQWLGAQWISGASNGKRNGRQILTSLPVPSLCRATAYVSAPGGFQLWVNGKEVGAGKRFGVMEWMQFDVRGLYHTADLTDYMQVGNNSIGFVLGGGVWEHYFKQESVIKAVVVVEHTDGTLTSTLTGVEDFLSADGYITADDPWAGTTTDWRIFEPDWSSPSFDPSKSVQTWSPPTLAKLKPSNQLESLAMPDALTVGEARGPLNATKLGENHYVYAFPINTAGITLVTVPPNTPAGATLSLKHGEVLLPNGSVSFPWNESWQTDVHIMAAGQDGQVLSPRFTWHAFQFVEAVGTNGFVVDGSLDFVRQQTIHTNLERTGWLHVSGGQDAQLLNQIDSITRNSQLMNVAAFMPTDCVSREKHGWLGDSVGTAEEAMFNFNMAPVYRRFLRTMVDSQNAQGDLPGAVPLTGFKGSDADAYKGHGGAIDISWTTAFPQITRWQDTYYGDLRPAENHWSQLTKYMNNLESTAPLPYAWTWGDWCAVEARAIATPDTGPQLASFNFILSSDSMAALAQATGNAAAFKHYSNISSTLRPAYYHAYYNESTGLFGETSLEVQSCTAAPLVLGGVVPSNDSTAFVQRFAKHIAEADNHHLTFGSIGAKHVLPTLTAHGLFATALTIATQRTHPSYGYWIENGATSAWEDWSGVADPTHPPPPTHDHVFLVGGVGEWLWRSVVGLAPAGPGYSSVRVAPEVVDGSDVTGAEGLLVTVQGNVSVAWAFDGSGAGRLSLNTTVPPGATATVAVPVVRGNAATATVQEGESVVWEAGHFKPGTSGVTGGSVEGNKIELSVSSGQYAFECKFA